MSDWKLPWEGGCRCGAVRIRVTKPPILSSACHCSGCQRMSASAFSLTLTLPADGLEITQGETVLGGLNRDMHHFCPCCMTWMFTRPPGLDWMVNLRPSALDDHAWFKPFVETFTNERLDWAETGAVHSYATAPDLPDYEPIVKEFADRGPLP